MKDHKKTAFINILTVAALVALLAAAALAAPPANDNFNTAEVIGGVSGTVSGTNTEATTQPCEPSFSIQSFQSVWYKWTAPETRSYTFKIDTSTSSTTAVALSEFALTVACSTSCTTVS